MNSRPDTAGEPARVLIVDDERRNRDVLEVMLGTHGYHLLTAASGGEALAMVAQQQPDLILLDIMMPGMDGYEVAGKIKSDLATKHIPIIMVTALGDRDARMVGLNAGAEDFLTKPVDRAELCARVKNLLRLKAYGDYYDQYSQTLEGEVASRTADLVARTKTLEQQAAVLTEQVALLDLAQDAVVVRDMQGRISFWSRGAEVMFGWRCHEAFGRTMSELLSPEFSEPIDYIEGTLLREGQWEGEAIHKTRDGKRLVVCCRWALQRGPDGAPVRVLTINSDITARKLADSEILLLTEREKSRKDQLRFKDEFLSHVSHELRSPLTAIKQFTTILHRGLAGELNKEQGEYLQIVLKNIRQLQSMIDDLLEVTRLESGKLTVEPERASVSDAVTDAVNTLQVTAGAKGVTVSTTLAPHLPHAHADQTRLRQILIILLDNAIKFSRGRCRHHSGTAAARSAVPAGRSLRYRLRYQPEGNRETLRAPLPGLGVHPGQPERSGTGLVHLQGTGDATRRPDLGRTPAGEGQHVFLYAACLPARRCDCSASGRSRSIDQISNQFRGRLT
jgi:PAS domain S-box-containing protein